MDVIALKDLRQRAEETVKSGGKWHFHLLTPKCKLNQSSDFALVLEINGETFVHYAEKAPKTASKELAKLLHGAKTFAEKPAASKSTPDTFKKLLNRAEKLSEVHTPWHHHMLFPGCIFNQQGNKWIIMLEDPIQPDPMGCAFESEPKEDIKRLEQLFYAQQNLS